MATKEEILLQFIGDLVRGTEYEGKVFLVGGAVRDEVMGSSPKDIDLVVAMPDGGIKFAEWAAIKTNSYKHGTNPLTFPKFGTAKFNFRNLSKNNEDLSDIDVEVVMTRGEKYEPGSRKPEVVYADLNADAQRRDLTVNALYKDVVTGEVKDPTGHGMADIKNGIVRTPSDPNVIFKEDPLRMMRAVRFAVKYGWKMTPEVLTAIQQDADSLQTISKERIKEELNKILMTNNPDVGLRMLTDTGLNKHIIPELDLCIGVDQNEHHKDTVYDHILEVVKNTAPDLTARLSSLFHDIGKPETKTTGPDGRIHFYKHEDVGAKMAKDIMTRLRYTTEEQDNVSRIVEHHMDLKNGGDDGSKASDKQLRKFIVNMGSTLVSGLKTMHADNVSHGEGSMMPNQIKQIALRIKDLKDAGADEKPTLPINGNDIMQALNIKPGPEVKKMLAVVQDAWYKDPSISREDALNLIKTANDTRSAPPEEVPITRKKLPADILNQKIKNPDTGNDILIKTALGYDKGSKVRQAAMSKLRQLRGK